MYSADSREIWRRAAAGGDILPGEVAAAAHLINRYQMVAADTDQNVI